MNSDLSCGIGCNYCCHYHVLVTAPEVFAIVEYIEKLPKTERKQVHTKIKNTAEVTTKLTAQEYIDTNIPCAILVDGKCSVYEVRPLACRRHHSLDVKICEETFNDVHSKVTNLMRHDRMVMSSALENAHLYTQHHKKLDTTQYELHAALNQAISNKNVFQRWLDHKMAFPNVKDRNVIM